MSEKNRVAYVLLQEEGLSIKEAAAVLGTAPDVVKQRAHRAYARLRTAVGAAGWNERADLARDAVTRQRSGIRFRSERVREGEEQVESRRN